MPLRGRHPGHKPYRIEYEDKAGKRRHKSYHWRGPWKKDTEYLRRPGNLMGTLIRAWKVEPVQTERES